MKKLLLLLVVCSLVLGILPAGMGLADALPIADGDVTLTIYSNIAPGASQIYTDLSEHPVIKRMEEETGLKFKFIHAPAGDDGTFFSTLVASGEWPDLWHAKFTRYPGGAEAAMEDGVLLNMNELIEAYSPNFNAIVKSYGVEKEFVSDAGVVVNYGATMLPDIICDKVFYGFLIRNDLLAELGLEMPYTYDEMEAVLVAFQEAGYSTPMAVPFRDGNFYTHNNLAAGFGVTHNGWFLKDGQAVYSPIQPEYKDYLAKLADWYAKGFFNSDSFGYNFLAAREAMQADKVAIGYAHAAHSTIVKTVGLENKPDYDVIGVPVMRQEKDDVVNLVFRSLRVSTGEPWYISATSKHPEEAMRFLDYLYSDETRKMTAWGLSGDDDVPTFVEVDGERVFTEFMTNNPEGIDFQTAKDRYCLLPFQVIYDEEMEYQQYNYPEKLGSIENFGYNTTNEGLYPSYATMTADESREYDQIMTQIDTYTSEMMEKFISGQASLDGFDAYVEQVKALNIERAAQIKTAAYERYMNR